MDKRVLAVAAGAWTLAFVLVGCTAPTETDASPSPDATSAANVEEAVDWLFVQNAQSGSLEPAGGDDYELTLAGIGDMTTEFSDTPNRYVETVPTDQLAFILQDPETQLNAALQVGTDAPATVALTLTDASYDADTATMTYAVTLITEDSAGDPAALGDLPQNPFSPVALFIDGWKIHYPSDVKRGPFAVGSVCSGTDNVGVGVKWWCWWIERSPQYTGVKITFKNTGNMRGYINQCFDDFNKDYLEPGEELTKTYKRNNKCLSLGWDDKDAAKDGKVLEFTILAIEDVG